MKNARILRRTTQLAAAGLSALALVACVSVEPPGITSTLPERLPQIERAGTRAAGPVTIRWNNYAVPFIEAERDEDVPYAMGLVHAHLRLGQMQLLRMGAQGRLAEMAGPIATDFDHTLRAINFPAGARASEAAMRPDTKAWVQRYVDGLNDYQQSLAAPPRESSVLAIPQEPWTVLDVLTIGRLAGTDINWATFGALLNNRAEPGFVKLYQRMLGFGQAATSSFGPPGTQPLDLLSHVSKSGSNSWAIAGTARGGGPALIANDPHVGFNLPSLWVVIGARSPGYQALGLTIPGVPVILVGTNGTIAWGGTNMIGLASAMYDVTDLPADQSTKRSETIKVRFWASSTRVIEETPLGPVMTGTPLLKPDDKLPRAERRRKVAWQWRGREASDEVSAFLDANRAQNWPDFFKAFAPYAVSGQNFLYADKAGNIGQLIALSTSPAAGRIAPLPIGEPANPEHAWGTPLKPTDLPSAFNPPEGYLISANNTPAHTSPRITLSTNANDRVDRLRQLIEADHDRTWQSQLSHQLDVYSKASHALAQAITAFAASTPPGESDRIRALLATWDGRYNIDSLGAPAIHRVMYELAKPTYEALYGAKSTTYLLGSAALAPFLTQDLGTPSNPGPAATHLRDALLRAENSLDSGTTWGDIHRLRISHVLGFVPIVGSPYRYDEFPVDGALTTVFKSATDVGPGVQRSRYGANARHISDLRDPDENHFVLLGGQDGWLGSANFADQVQLWRDGKLIRIPFTPQAVQREFPIETRLLPAAPK